MIWLAFALMTAAVVLCLVWPLAGRAQADDAASADVDFYTSQLAEVQGDVGRGLIGQDEAAGTRAEIARRLIATARRTGATLPRRSRSLRVVAIVAAVAAVPALSLALYLRLGHPDNPDLPLAERDDPQGRNIAAAIPRIEAHLVAHPEDGKGFALIAPVYMQMGRFNDAAKAYAAALRLLGESAEWRAAVGQAQVMGADGVVTTEARASFDRALVDDPKLPEARFFEALAAEQDNDKPRALALWQALLADSEADAPWRPSVVQHIAILNGQPVGAPPNAPVEEAAPPNGAAGAAIAALPPDAQRQAIQGMVDALAGRLAQNGRDSEGWLRLIRAYKVLGEDDRARAAIVEARKGLDGDAGSLARIDALVQELGLRG